MAVKGQALIWCSWSAHAARRDHIVYGRACQKAHWQRHKPLCSGSPTAPSVRTEHDSLIVAWDRNYTNHIVAYVAGSIYNTFLHERGRDVPAEIWAWFASRYTVEIKLQKVKTEKKVQRENRVRFTEANFVRAEDAIPQHERLVRFREAINARPYTIAMIYRLFEGPTALCMVTISHGFIFNALFVGGVAPPTSSIYQSFLENSRELRVAAVLRWWYKWKQGIETAVQRHQRKSYSQRQDNIIWATKYKYYIHWLKMIYP
ncbi:hypothetical protein BDZ97DRAFT_1754545 [Flammula alnicola]|nr:hypothetical protein BDZ97DRAFT_1754545 [Flammula alnicola]